MNLENVNIEELTIKEEYGHLNTCSENEIEKLFPIKYKKCDEFAISLKKDYVLNMAKNKDFSRIACGLSNGVVRLFDIDQQYGLSPSSIANFSYPESICGVKFMDESPYNLLIATKEGIIRLIDLRSCVIEASFDVKKLFNEKTKATKTLTTFDINSNGRIICAGSEEYRDEVVLTFFDVRQRTVLGGYFESHHDDITSIVFHPNNPDLLATGSTDGLINIFDIKKDSEKKALNITINTTSSVHKINWHIEDDSDVDVISCITHLEGFHLYDCKEGNSLAYFGVDNINASAKLSETTNNNLISAHNTSNNGVFILTGINNAEGEILRALNIKNNELLPMANFTGNTQIIRESLYDEKSHAIITGGESGLVTLWKAQSDLVNNNICDKSNLKMKSSKKIKADPPYTQKKQTTK